MGNNPDRSAESAPSAACCSQLILRSVRTAELASSSLSCNTSIFLYPTLETEMIHDSQSASMKFTSNKFIDSKSTTLVRYYLVKSHITAPYFPKQ